MTCCIFSIITSNSPSVTCQNVIMTISWRVVLATVVNVNEKSVGVLITNWQKVHYKCHNTYSWALLKAEMNENVFSSHLKLATSHARLVANSRHMFLQTRRIQPWRAPWPTQAMFFWCLMTLISMFFVPCDLDLWLFDPKMNGLSRIMVEYFWVKFGDPSCIGFFEIWCGKTDT